jgi:hypothetical protein
MSCTHRISRERTKIGFFVARGRPVQSGTQPRGLISAVRWLSQFIQIAQRVGADSRVCLHNPPPAASRPPPPAGDTRPGTGGGGEAYIFAPPAGDTRTRTGTRPGTLDAWFGF